MPTLPVAEVHQCKTEAGVCSCPCVSYISPYLTQDSLQLPWSRQIFSWHFSIRLYLICSHSAELALIFSPLYHETAQESINYQAPPAVTATVETRVEGTYIS